MKYSVDKPIVHLGKRVYGNPVCCSATSKSGIISDSAFAEITNYTACLLLVVGLLFQLPLQLGRCDGVPAHGTSVKVRGTSMCYPQGLPIVLSFRDLEAQVEHDRATRWKEPVPLNHHKPPVNLFELEINCHGARGRLWWWGYLSQLLTEIPASSLMHCLYSLDDFPCP